MVFVTSPVPPHYARSATIPLKQTHTSCNVEVQLHGQIHSLPHLKRSATNIKQTLVWNIVCFLSSHPTLTLTHHRIMLLHTTHPWNLRHTSDGLPASAAYSVFNGLCNKTAHDPTDLPSSHVSSVPYSRLSYSAGHLAMNYSTMPTLHF